jgi:hypothetical protein
MIRGMGFDLSKSETHIIDMMTLYVSGGKKVTVTDLQCHRIQYDAADTILVYGNRAWRMLKDVDCRTKIRFPAPSKLDTTHGDPDEIDRAKAKLVLIKEALADNTIDTISDTDEEPNLTEEIPEDLTAADVKILEIQQRRQDKIYWKGMTKSGRSLRVTVEPEQGTADINITFAELYAIIGLRETLQVKELEFVYKPSTTAGKSNTQ